MEIVVIRLNMGSIRRSKSLESAISTFLIGLLVLIGIGVFLKQSDADMSRFGISQAVKPKSEIPFEPSSLVPAGFETPSEVEIYVPENLYEKIDGKAPLYIESGFEKLFTQRFISKDDQALWMEIFIYDMGAVNNAFSIFSVQRRADADIISIFLPSYAYNRKGLVSS